MGFKTGSRVKKKSLATTLVIAVNKLLRLATGLFYKRDDIEIWINDLKIIRDYEPLMRGIFHCRRLNEGDASIVADVFGRQYAEIAMHDLRLGHQGFVIFENDALVGYSWATACLKKDEGSAPFLFDVYPKEGFMYFYGDYVLPEKRGKGANTIMAQYRWSEAAKEGFKVGIGFVNKRNLAQQKILTNWGCKKAGTLFFRKYLWHDASDTSALKSFCR